MYGFASAPHGTATEQQRVGAPAWVQGVNRVWTWRVDGVRMGCARGCGWCVVGGEEWTGVWTGRDQVRTGGQSCTARQAEARRRSRLGPGGGGGRRQEGGGGARVQKKIWLLILLKRSRLLLKRSALPPARGTAAGQVYK